MVELSPSPSHFLETSEQAVTQAQRELNRSHMVAEPRKQRNVGSTRNRHNADMGKGLNTYTSGAIAVVAAGVILFTYVLSPLPMFWEHEDQPLVYSITWHSGLAFLLLAVFIYLVISLVLRKRLG